MSYRAHPSTLVVNRELLGNGQAAPDSRSARHIELELPARMDYETGDHLGVLPRNNVDLIRRVMARFGLDAGTYLTIYPTGEGTFTHRPMGAPAPLLGILGACVELQDVASRSDLAMLAQYATDPEEPAELLTMSGLDEEDYSVPTAGQSHVPMIMV
jgi:cytochrome P450 / NADPH-cytochrome P450 reductase